MVLQRQGFLKAEARCGRASLKRHWTASGGVVRSARFRAGAGAGAGLRGKRREQGGVSPSDCDVCEVAQLVLLFGSFRCCAR